MCGEAPSLSPVGTVVVLRRGWQTESLAKFLPIFAENRINQPCR